jgi:hypothetical protein
MFRASKSSTSLRRLLAALLAISVLGGCTPSSSEEEEEEEQEEEEEAQKKKEKEKEQEEEAECGNGVCEEGETSACSDCAPEPECGNGVCEEGETSACSDCAPPPSDGSIVVENYSDYSVYYLYIVPCGSSSWGSDLLGDSVLPSGYKLEFTEVPPGCYDLLAEASSDVYWASEPFNVTAGQTYTVTLN